LTRSVETALCDIVKCPRSDVFIYTLKLTIGNESVPIQLAQVRFPGLAISNAKIIITVQIKYTEAIPSNSTRSETVIF